jgi:hypothetical protein
MGRGAFTYLKTASFVVERTVASSLIKWGLFPVFSSWSITPTTMSSLMLSVSTRLLPSAPGEGGGVSLYAALPLLLGRSTNETFLADVTVDDRGRDGDMGEGAVDACDRLIFFVGGGCVSCAEGFGSEGR